MMKVKSRKRIMMMFMSLMLATTGCANKSKNSGVYRDDYQEESYDVVSYLLENNNFYKDEYRTVKDSYVALYWDYLDKFIKHMSKEQYDIFIELVDNMNGDERNEYPETLNYLNTILNVKDDSYGRGFFKVFNYCILEEHLDVRGNFGGELSNPLKNLVAIVDNDEELFSSIFSGNIESVIDTIMENTGFDDREVLKELILKMDAYTDILVTDEILVSNEYMAEKIKDSYEMRIKEIIGMIISSKCEKYPDFSDSLYMTLLRGSWYYGRDKYSILPGITTDTFTVDVKDPDEVYSLPNLNKAFLYGSNSMEDLKCVGVNNILARSFHLEDEDDNAVSDMMQLLMCLLDSNITFSDIDKAEDFRKLIFDNLSKYFGTQEEFNTFVLELYSSKPTVLDQYFNILIQSIKDNGITYDDYLRFNALVNYNNQRKYMNVSFNDSDNYIDRDDLANMKEEEYRDIASSSEDNYFLGSVDYQKYFKEIDKLLAENNLGFEFLYDKDLKTEWIYGTREIVGDNDASVISFEVVPEMMEYSGTNIIFYEYPEYYEDGVAVEVFNNINNEMTAREIEGFKGKIIDPMTGITRTIFVVNMDSSKEGYANIRFMVDYEAFTKSHEDTKNVKQVLSGGEYE